MTLDEIKEQQQADIAAFNHLLQTDPEKAAQCAKQRLTAAGIIDQNGNLAEPYR